MRQLTTEELYQYSPILRLISGLSIASAAKNLEMYKEDPTVTDEQYHLMMEDYNAAIDIYSLRFPNDIN